MQIDCRLYELAVRNAQAALDAAQQQVGALTATVRASESALGVAVAALDRAQLDLAFATIIAPSRGAVEGCNIDVGQFAGAGQPLATFVSTHDVWVQADMRENNVSNGATPGDAWLRDRLGDRRESRRRSYTMPCSW